MEQRDELKSHIRDLADRAFNRNIMTHTGFLSLAEQSEILSMERELAFVQMVWFGGMEGCERKMLIFCPDKALNVQKPEYKDLPVSCLAAEPLMKKFSDRLSHRDFLGALMNLGIDREVLGDIVVRDNSGYIFCEDRISDYICENLTRVKNTSVKCTKAEECPESAKPLLQDETHVVASNRCDAVVSKVYNLSRSRSIELFRTKNIFIDGRQCENSSADLKNGEIVSVRGQGRFIFEGILDETRKGKIRVRIKKYI